MFAMCCFCWVLVFGRDSILFVEPTVGQLFLSYVFTLNKLGSDPIKAQIMCFPSRIIKDCLLISSHKLYFEYILELSRRDNSYQSPQRNF